MNQFWDGILDGVDVCMFAPPASANDFSLGIWRAWLSKDERHQCDQRRTPQLQYDYLLAHAFCRATLSLYANCPPQAWRFSIGQFGKPRIASPEVKLQFNLTHTRGLVACAVTRAGKVGVDVEDLATRVDADSIAQHFMSFHERRAMEMIPATDRSKFVLEQWVLKEAYLKGRGVGLSRETETVTILDSTLCEPKGSGHWHLSLYHVTSTHVAAIALRTRLPKPSIRWQWASLTETGIAIVG